MALRIWGVREALQTALALGDPLAVSPLLDANARALVGELAQADTLALNALRGDDTIAPGQRNARAAQIRDKVFALNITEAQHEPELGIGTLYAMMDLSLDCSGAIAAGVGTFVSDLGDG